MTSFAQPAFAAGITNPVLPNIGTGGQAQGALVFGNALSAIIGIFLILGFIFSILHFIFGAIRWITASGDKSHLQNAQERMTQAVVGLIVLGAIWAIIILVSNFTNIGIIDKTTGSLQLLIPKLSP